MERFTQNELDDIFVALLLHSKTTREEQAEWVTERAGIWRKIVAASDRPPSQHTNYRTELFESRELVRRFWKSPDEIQKAFVWPVNGKAKKAKAER